MYSKRRKVSITFDPEQGMTRQEFQNECNINTIMAKYQRTGILDHITKYQPLYGDFDAVDFQTAMDTIKAGEEMFAELPSQARRYFDNDPATFMAFVNDPDNADKLIDLGLASKPVQTPETPDPVPTPDPASDNPT